ncbi:hypothetical protein [Caudoviricetes sp.]|nr:hypothetical protein [Caudoviricetes sp.]UOF79654.1 hypothetical protein [Caudoviricetes sp.]UOF79871.1 hypothetical protein [Bacteriophage sp.]UOF81325.1 hypothetical protein [Caudoviricetes sp.]
MPVAWYQVPMVILSDRGRPYRSLDFDRPAATHGETIRAAGGDYAFTEISATSALVKVRAPLVVLNGLRTAYPISVNNPALLWQTTRAKPSMIAGEIRYDSGKISPCTPWQWKDREVLNDVELADMKAKRDALILLADQKGYHRFTPVDRFEKAILLRMFGEAGYGLDRVSTGTFPTNTTILDSFAGADENPITTNWTTPAWGGGGNCRLLSNELTQGGNGGQGAYYDIVTSYGPDVEAYATLLFATISTSRLAGPMLRLGGVLGGLLDGYTIGPDRGGWNNWFIQRWDDSVPTNIAGPSGGTFASGDKAGGEIISTTLTGYRYTTSWASVITTTDSTYTAAGAVGLYVEHDAANINRFDDFVAGTVVVPGSLLPRRHPMAHMVVR